jgi:hypothetical protein
MLSAEIAATSTTKDAFNHLLGNTKVGLLIATLTESTDIEGIDLLAQMSAEEATRLASLEKTLGESDPKKKANELRLAAARVEALKTKIEAALAWVKDEAIQKFKTMDSDAEAATATELSAADALRAGEVLLPGTGEVLWKTLFQAAREFSLAAYPGASFPHIHDGARCVLCQQVLTHDAGQRLVRFEQYVQASVAKIANERRLARSAAATKIGQATLSFDVDAALSEELSILDAQVVEDIVNFESAIDARRNWLLFAQQHHQWAGEPMLPTDPCTRLQAIANDLKLQERNYAKVADDKQRLQLQVELAELKARAALAPHKQAAIDLVGRMKTKALLSSCRHALRTKPISDKAKELASSAVTTPLRAALKSEFDALGVSAILPQLRETVEKGKMRHKLALAFETEAEIREILSEGEQRAIAIGAFLAELRTGGHEGGIVFDDPVSSLDHFRRQDVARRLVQEAQSRQVVIFTHDTSFLGEILDLIDQTGVGNLIHHLEWDEGYAGKLEPGLPWQHQSYKDRINKMQHAQGKLSKGWPPYPNDKQSAAMRSQYNRLRATIERVIQDVVFNGVVKRYRDWIRVDRLSEVVGFTDSEYREIARLHKKCCEVVDAHDPSSGKNAPVPTAVDLGIDIGALVAVTDAIQARRKAKATVSGP